MNTRAHKCTYILVICESATERHKQCQMLNQCISYYIMYNTKNTHTHIHIYHIVRAPHTTAHIIFSQHISMQRIYIWRRIRQPTVRPTLPTHFPSPYLCSSTKWLWLDFMFWMWYKFYGYVFAIRILGMGSFFFFVASRQCCMHAPTYSTYLYVRTWWWYIYGTCDCLRRLHGAEMNIVVS